MSISLLTFPMARDKAKALDWVLQDRETAMLTIVQTPQFIRGSRLIHQRPHYILYPGPPFTGFSMLDLLLLEVLQDPTRNTRYILNAEQCAQIAQSLWLSILPWWVQSVRTWACWWSFLVWDRSAQKEFTVDESQIAKLVQTQPIEYNDFTSLLGHTQNLILLPQFLSRVSNDFANGDVLSNLLRTAHKYPLLNKSTIHRMNCVHFTSRWSLLPKNIWGLTLK